MLETYTLNELENEIAKRRNEITKRRAANPKRRKRYCIEGEWSGYNSGQRRICYREYTESPVFAKEVEDLGCITYTDGTRLHLSVRELAYREKKGKEMSSYRDLVRKCLKQGTSFVDALTD